MLVWLLVVFVTTLVTFVLPEQFASTARIKVERDRSDIAEIAGQSSPAAYNPYFIHTEFEVMKSELILGKVIEDQDLNRRWGL